MKNLLIFLFLTSLIYAGCTRNSRTTGLSEDPVIQAVFHEDEIESLENILLFFRDAFGVTDEKKPEEIESLFREYLDHMDRNTTLAGEVYEYLNFDPAKKQKLIDDLKKTELFENLYREDTTYFDKTRNRFTQRKTDSIVATRLEPAINGRYFQLIEEWGKTDSLFYEYSHTISITWDITPWMIASMVREYERFDLKSERVQLFYAMTYLMLREAIYINRRNRIPEN